jgi:hypothetical protein
LRHETAKRAAELSVVNENKIKIHRIVAATDPGYAVNPAQIQRQIAGSFVYGLSALFYQECTVKGWVAAGLIQKGILSARSPALVAFNIGGM